MEIFFGFKSGFVLLSFILEACKETIRSDFLCGFSMER